MFEFVIAAGLALAGAVTVGLWRDARSALDWPAFLGLAALIAATSVAVGLGVRQAWPHIPMASVIGVAATLAVWALLLAAPGARGRAAGRAGAAGP
ncbi:MAG: hypothetical protein AB7V42_12855 [Thermoleophilia bacterium]